MNGVSQIKAKNATNLILDRNQYLPSAVFGSSELNVLSFKCTFSPERIEVVDYLPILNGIDT